MKKVNVFTLLEEIEDIDIDLKNKYKQIYDFIYFDKKWPYLTIQKNKIQLHNMVEKLIKSDYSTESD